MKLLLCVQFYYPSIGGVQEVMKQLAERLAAGGHEVTVATAIHERRDFEHFNGVSVRQFKVSGNRVQGMIGDVEGYRQFLRESDSDVVLFYAAQQWTFDAAWEVIDLIKGKKVLVPCGYSALHLATYKEYFLELPSVLRKFDHLIYHALSYRDYAFGMAHNLRAASLIPNGADDIEFAVPATSDFRKSFGIGTKDFVLLTVGTLNGMKGHLELATAFRLAQFSERPATLILNANTKPEISLPRSVIGMLAALRGNARSNGWRHTCHVVLTRLLCAVGVQVDLRAKLERLAHTVKQESGGEKNILICDLSRKDLVQAYLNADLFVLASKVEYSPLVLFEACAAGLPFLTAPVGNAAEIVEWTGAGEVYTAKVDNNGFAHTDPALLANHIEAFIRDPLRLKLLKTAGRDACRNRFNWKMLTEEYEKLFRVLIKANNAKNLTLDKDVELNP